MTEGHHIEELARVYLRLNDAQTAWEIDAPTLDGSPLFGYDDGPLNEECQCADKVACKALVAKAGTEIDLPTAEQLWELLGVALGKLPAPDRLATPGKTYDHDPAPDSMPGPGDTCKTCGEDITWVGPGQYDWLHVDDQENR